MKAKKMVCFIVLCSLLCTTFTGCSSVVDTKKKDGRLKVVATVFAEYDFLRHIAGDKINLSMLMLPGADLHAFDPTPKDVASVQSADLFVTIGGESDAWSEKIMESVDNKNLQTIQINGLRQQCCGRRSCRRYANRGRRTGRQGKRI